VPKFRPLTKNAHGFCKLAGSVVLHLRPDHPPVRRALELAITHLRTSATSDYVAASSIGYFRSAQTEAFGSIHCQNEVSLDRFLLIDLHAAREQVDVFSTVCKAERAVEVGLALVSLQQPFGFERLEIGQVAQ
jgi:hypothetical protein